MKHIGLDTHSTTTLATVLNDRGRKILRRQIATRELDLIDFMKSIPGPKRVALEESQMADFVTRVIAPYVREVIRCQPQYNRLISESEKKCDEEDSHTLAADNALAQQWQAGLAAGVASDRLRRNLARKIAVLAQYLLRSKEQYNNEP